MSDRAPSAVSGGHQRRDGEVAEVQQTRSIRTNAPSNDTSSFTIAGRMSEPIDVRAVAGRREFRRFIDYMYERNAGDPHWVAPLRLGEHERLNPKKNPFFEHAEVELLLACRGDRVVGRIAAIDDRLHGETHHDNAAMFGFFEAADGDAAAALLAAVERWAQDARAARGCAGRSARRSTKRAGCWSTGSTPIRCCSCRTTRRSTARTSSRPATRRSRICSPGCTICGGRSPPAFTRAARRLRDAHRITIRPLNLREFTREVEALRALYCTAWERNWGFVPPTVAEFRRLGDGAEADLRSTL